MAIDRERITSIVESLIFVSETPLSFRKIRSILEGVPTKELQSILEELQGHHRSRDRGIILDEVAEGYQFRTPPENQEWVKMLVEYKPIRLSRAALETLAIFAYQQPATKVEVEAIRGVDCSSSVARLLELGLVKILGRKDMPGRPFIYGTTPEFLEIFNLVNLDELPSLREIEDLAPEEIEAYSEKLAAAAGDQVETAEEENDAEVAEPSAGDAENENKDEDAPADPDAQDEPSHNAEDDSSS
ncbi:MAG: SMC-Scp complex subunit ScpB [Candidatus Lernaella stagnicola]|nr:SMC-Scp complex subunit ScpB [Candidatus Lernaella stagnicola]